MAHTITRRSLFQAAGLAAASILLPHVPGGVLAPTAALADKVGAAGTASRVQSMVILVSKGEVAFVAYDLAQVDEHGNAQPLAGVHVTVTSGFNGAVAEGTTNKSGLVILNIEGLSEGYDGATELEECVFNGSVTATKDGYRVFRTGRLRIEGASGIAVPTRPADDATPYATLLTFNDYDAQYLPATFVRTPKNTERHTLALELFVPDALLAKAGSAGAATVELRADGADEAIDAGPLALDGNAARATLTGDYLRDAADNARLIPAETTLYLLLRLGHQAWRLSTTLRATDGVVDEFTQSQDDFDLMAATNDEANARMPGWFPALLGGSVLNMWVPKSLVMFEYSPYGHLMLGVTTPGLGFVREKGESDPKGFGLQERGEFKKELARRASDGKACLARYRDSLLSTRPATSAICRMPLAASISVTAAAQLLATAIFGDEVENGWAGSLEGVVVGTIDTSISENVLAGVVPVFVTFEFTASLRFALGIGLTSSAPNFTLADVGWSYDSTGLTIYTPVSAALTAGLGVAGVLSVGIRGVADFATKTVFGPAPAGKKNVHFTASAGARLELAFQALLARWSFQLVGEDLRPFYDSWDDEDVANGAGTASTSGSPFSLGATGGIDAFTFAGGAANGLSDLARFLAAGTPVSQAELAASATVRQAGEKNAPATRLVSGTPEPVGNMELITFVDPENGTPTAGLVGEQFSFEDTRGPANVAAESAPELAANGGIGATVDQRISEGVFSDPRVHAVGLAGKTFVFRIATVLYEGVGARTRLVAQELDTSGSALSEQRVIEFATSLDEVSRTDLFDYDFDVCAYDHKGTPATKPGFRILMVSGTRPAGDATDAASALANTWVCALFLDADLKAYAATVTRPKNRQVNAACHGYSNPKIILGSKDGRGVSHMAALIHRTADTPEGLVAEDATATLQLGVLLWQGMRLTLTRDVQLPSDIVDIDLQLRAGAAGCALYDACAIACVSQSRTDVFTLRRTGEAAGATLTGSETAAAVVDALRGAPASIEVVQSIAGAPAVAALRAWPGHEGWLFSSDGHLWHADFDDAETGASEFATTDVGAADFNFQDFFASPDGSFLYMAQNRDVEEKATSQSADNNRDGQAGEFHRILASKLIGGRFTLPFPFAELKHAVHGLSCVRESATSATFIATEITSLAQSAANLWLIKVPCLKAASADACVLDGPVAYLGRENRFNVTMTNHGNVALAEAAVHLHAADDTPLAHAAVSFEAGNARRSVWAPDAPGSGAEAAQTAAALDAAAGEDPVLDPVGAGVLLPGQTGTYEVTFQLPEEWPATGEGADEDGNEVRGVRAVTGQLTTHACDTTSVNLALASVEQPLEAARPSDLRLQEGTTLDLELGRGDVTPVGSGEESGGDHRPGGSGNEKPTTPGAGNGNRKPAATPDTGDDASAALPAMLGIAGAALLAYERGTAR